jgi:tryptophan-rich sensory protein
MSSIASSLSARAPSPSVKRTPFALLGVGTVLASVTANTLCFFVGGALVTYDPEFLPLANVSGEIIMTVVPAILAVLLYAALRRFTQHPARIFTIVAAIVFVVTLIPVFTYIPTVPGWTSAQAAVLVVMHTLAACVIVGMLTNPDRSPTR